MLNKRKLFIEATLIFYYFKLIIIILKVDLFKNCLDTTRVDEVNLRFVICYSKCQYKKNNLSNFISYETSTWNDWSW